MKTLALLLSKKARFKYENELALKSGVLLSEPPRINRQNTFFMLLLKTLIVFFALMGSIDCYMSGFGISYDYMLTAFIAALIAAVFSLANTSPILTVIIYFISIYMLSAYVNTNFDVLLSGGTAIVNLSYKVIMKKYNFPSVDGFEEIIPDRSLTIPALIVTGSVFMGMILAFFICRFMNLMLVTLITMLPLSMVLFFDASPSYIGFAMLVSSWILTAMVKFGGKFSRTLSGRRMGVYYFKDNIFFKQICDGTAMLQSAALIFITAAVCIAGIHSFFGSKVFDDTVPASKTKSQLDYALRDAMIIAFSNYKNYKITDMSSSGQLGFYGNIQPDFEPDLKITLMPYTSDRIYFRTFIGSDYKYKDNYWQNKPENSAYTDKSAFCATAEAAKAAGINARIKIKNLAVSGSNGYMPYYTDIDDTDLFSYIQDDIAKGSLELGDTVDIVFHPLSGDKDIVIADDTEYRNYVYKNYLSVPDELRLKLNALCGGEGFNADDDGLDQKISSYFQNNFEYNTQSGRLPWNTDFVEYFLFESKKGVCAHFASSAVLIYRSLGIPAHYIEGYCADYPAIMSGTPLKDENPADWLSGTAPLSRYVMETELSDYNAHAWVEIYDDDKGWITVDPTPYADPELLKQETEKKSFLEELLEHFESARNKKHDESAVFELLGKIAAVILASAAALAAAIPAFILVRPLLFLAKKAIYKRNKGRYVGMELRHLNALAVCASLTDRELFYRELCGIIADAGMDRENADRLELYAQKAIYGRTEPTDKEYSELISLIAEARRTLYGNMPLFKRIYAFFASHSKKIWHENR